MSTSVQAEARDLVAQAAAWRLAALLLERPRPGWHQEVQRLSREVLDQQLKACARAAEQATEERYHRLFGPGAMVSPREVSYAGLEDPGRLMAHLSGFYRAFAFAPKREEPFDHISVEAGFVGYLFLKEAYSRRREDDESACISRSARRQFMREHLERCASGMRDRLRHGPAYLRDVLQWIIRPSLID